MKKVILSNILLMILSINVFGQIRKGIDIDTMINNKYLEFKLKVDKDSFVSLEIQNKTYDTLFLRTKLEVEQQNMLFYIAGYEKRYKNREGKDSIHYHWGALWDYYGNILKDNLYIRLFGEGEKFLEKLPPKAKIITPLTYFNKGEYYLKIQTAYVYRKKMYFVRTETNKIKVK